MQRMSRGHPRVVFIVVFFLPVFAIYGVLGYAAVAVMGVPVGFAAAVYSVLALCFIFGAWLRSRTGSRRR